MARVLQWTKWIFACLAAALVATSASGARAHESENAPGAETTAFDGGDSAGAPESLDESVSAETCEPNPPLVAHLTTSGANDDEERFRLTRRTMERGVRLTRIGRGLTGAGAGVFIVSMIASAGPSFSCGWSGTDCEAYGAAMLGAGLGLGAVWAGTITWSSGTLISANGLRNGGIPVDPTAGRFAVTMSATLVPLAWAAAPIQFHRNRRAWRDELASPQHRTQWSLAPVAAGARWGATLGVRF